ncbi:MAG TPA: M3 family metallopeptidase [Thermoanaerobaculaceae bacterium]|nr:M3 family metallopeptidase [Thermoanaerobaculaceae bacterium]HRS14999.1 M3 family metallopeptidase [Thermoanaerobaculaceae bacterium]
MRRGWLVSVLVLAVALPAVAAPATPANPLLEEWKTPFGVPPFAEIRPEHFLPAIERGMAEQKKEVAAIVGNPAPPTFANTIEALDASGELLARVMGVFQNLVGAETNEALQEIARTTAPMMAAHRDDIALDPRLFERVKAVWEARASLALNPEQARLLEETYKGFVRGGALLAGEPRERFRAINAELAALGTKVGDNLLKEMNSYRLVIDDPADLAGLSERVRAGAAEAARKAGLEGKWVFTLHGPSLWPFLEGADNRELRKQIFTAYITRGDHGNELDTKALVARIAALRAERARLLGFDTWADFVLDDNMARTPARVYELLDRLWGPAKAVAAREAADLQAAIKADGRDFQLEPWDWFYYTAKVRKARFDLDEAALRPYFQLENVREGAFWVAHKLYGISFTEIENVPVYHPEVKAFEVKDADGSHLAVFYCDYFPRPGKRSGAWSSRYRGQYWKNGKEIRPIVVNVGNFSRPAGDTPALLSRDEVETLFHELGHGLHSILSRIHYRSLAGTPRDFVELPSQIMEHWAFEPEVLKVYAKHYKTGEVIPAELVRKIQESSKFNQGFATTEYLAAALLDMDWHTLTAAAPPETSAFERISLARMAMPRYIVPRYRSTYFQHIFGPGGGYSAGYYAYIWAEVLDADAFEAFKEKGLFDQATARSFRVNILEKGGTEDAMTMYVRFRGKEPSVEPLLANRGLK